MADKRLAEINHAAATTGDDPELDTLLLRLHTETACRRGSALALRPQDLDLEQCLILLRECATASGRIGMAPHRTRRQGDTERLARGHPGAPADPAATVQAWLGRPGQWPRPEARQGNAQGGITRASRDLPRDRGKRHAALTMAGAADGGSLVSWLPPRDWT